VELSVGLRFMNSKEFKEALQLFTVQNNFDYKYVHNDKKWVTTHCKSLCHWKIHASWTPCRKYFQIKTIYDEHNCSSNYYNKKETIRWAANRYVEIFRDQRDFKARALREMIRRDYNVEMTMLSCHRAKKMAIDIFSGRDGSQYCHT
jgi:zinc finger SWIM domain-containing protein 3